MTDALLENIDNLPPIAESVQELERVYNNSESTLDDITNVLQKDPVLTADILHLVNSPAYCLKNKINDIKHAVTLLGKDTIRTFALGSIIKSSFEIDLSPYGMSKDEFFNACSKQLALSVNWLRVIESENLSVLAPASFLVDLGRIIISKTLIEDQKSDIIETALLAGENISDAEIVACGVQTTDVTATLFEKWNFDLELINIIKYANDPYEAQTPQEQRLAAELKVIRESVMPNGDITEDSIATAKCTLEEFNLDLSSYEKAIEKIM